MQNFESSSNERLKLLERSPRLKLGRGAQSIIFLVEAVGDPSLSCPEGYLQLKVYGLAVA